LLAHTDLKQGLKVGRYTVNPDDLDAIGTASIERATRAGRIVFLDEIGKMEPLSKSFKWEVLRALDSPSRVVATVQERADDFCDSLKERDDVSLIRVTDSNRDDLPKRIIEALDSPIG
jgi:nucleoside-triphosphatase